MTNQTNQTSQTTQPHPQPQTGYDYTNQAWVEDGRYCRCGHNSPCGCYGRLHAGEPVAADAEVH